MSIDKISLHLARDSEGRATCARRRPLCIGARRSARKLRGRVVRCDRLFGANPRGARRAMLNSKLISPHLLCEAT